MSYISVTYNSETYKDVIGLSSMPRSTPKPEQDSPQKPRSQRGDRLPREQRRRQLVEISRGVFAERGYEAASLEERVLLVGNIDRVELWNPARFDEAIRTGTGEFEKFSNQIFG